MEQLKRLHKSELLQINGGIGPRLGIGGLVLLMDAAIAFMDGIEEAYYEKNPRK